jgi:hypothetical protein
MSDSLRPTHDFVLGDLEREGSARWSVFRAIVPWLDASRPWGAGASRVLTSVFPDAFGGTLHARGFARTAR